MLNFSSLAEVKSISVHWTTFSRTPSNRELYVPFKFVFSIYFSSKSLKMQLNSFTSYWLFCSLLFQPNAFNNYYVLTGFSSICSSWKNIRYRHFTIWIPFVIFSFYSSDSLIVGIWKIAFLKAFMKNIVCKRLFK